MNDMSEIPGGGSGGGDEPEIIFVSVEKDSYYIVRGDEHLNQVLIVGGKFPKPILCLKFDSIYDAKRIMGNDFSLASYWAIHPDIVARLRDEKCLIEADK